MRGEGWEKPMVAAGFRPTAKRVGRAKTHSHTTDPKGSVDSDNKNGFAQSCLLCGTLEIPNVLVSDCGGNGIHMVW